MENRMSMSTKMHSTPARTLLPSPIEKTPPTSTRKRVLNELSINLPPRPHSAQEFTTPEHPGSFKKNRKVSEPYKRAPQILPSSSAKRESPEEAKVWAPDVEAAFMDAIRLIPKLGRRKICIGSKPCGRNELIAAFICRRTGKVRTRKQVSSHIQVLKHIRRDDVEFLALVADGKDEDFDEVSPKFDAKDMDRLVQGDHASLSQGFHMSMSNEEDQSPLGKAQRFRNQSLEVSHTRIRLDDFRIWATKPQMDAQDKLASHVYTVSQKSASYPVMHIDAVRDWALRFPCLPQLITEPSAAQTPVFHISASLNIPDSLTMDPAYPCVLKSRLMMAGFEARGQEQWLCALRVYTMGRQILELREQPWPQGDWRAANGEGKLQICFASEFWAAFLGELSGPDPPIPGLSPEECRLKREREAQNALTGITVVQEIISMQDNLEPPRRHAVLIWEFTKAHPEEEGHTFVSRIALPRSQSEPVIHAMPMARTVSQPQSLPRQSSMRPKLGGASLQRSQSMAAVSQHPYYTSQSAASLPQRRQVSSPMPYAHLAQQQAIPSPAHDASMYYQPVFDQSQLHDSMESPLEASMSYTNMSSQSSQQQQAVSYAMARSYSAPTWAPGVAPTQYPSSVDTNLWNDNIFDWPLPESAGYLQSDFQIPSDDFYTTTPSRSQSTAPQSFTLGNTTCNDSGLDEVPDSRLPQLGFFPLNNF